MVVGDPRMSSFGLLYLPLRIPKASVSPIGRQLAVFKEGLINRLRHSVEELELSPSTEDHR